VGAKLYVIPGSHPCECAEAAMRLKGIEYQRVDLIPAIHAVVVRSRFPGRTVPALDLDGERIIGSRTILRRLDELRPEPLLLPDDPDVRAKVEDAEEWGDRVLQPLARRVAWAGFKRNRPSMLSYSSQAKLGLPKPFLKLGTGPAAAIASRVNGASDEQVQADLATLPGHLDKVAVWMDEGVLGGETPNVADLQIGSSIRLLGTFEDVKPMLSGRRCATLAESGFGPTVGSIPAGTLPREWVAQTGA
jgi:glutathione S-transferase